MTRKETVVREHLDALLFDLDGTVLDTARDFEQVLNLQLKAHHLPPVDYQKLCGVVSSGARAMVALGFGIDEDDEKFEVLRQEFLDLYGQHLCSASQLYPGMQEVLNWARREQLPLAIVTNKPSAFTLPLLERLGLGHYFGSVVCPDHVSHAKPSPEPILLAATQLAVRPQRCLYIGDHLRDVEAGRAAGMITVGCRYGYLVAGEKIEDWQADYLISEAHELIPLCEKLATAEAIEALNQ
ncbi:phosphoglycolate phosphatase [Sinobacterium caligoides]|uniref:Phosphoglycolate phosphatase n=1 Tax=Sinobacterium caligoides TaxID=933926 RepID=A0A3N2DZ43_9GAMM|nr:HAD-IA family hydrolase [Sinobacterium caligoides]ROS05141.1 phosphoglycolate phosphatase [Sinobacterium caligoides]